MLKQYDPCKGQETWKGAEIGQYLIKHKGPYTFIHKIPRIQSLKILPKKFFVNMSQFILIKKSEGNVKELGKFKYAEVRTILKEKWEFHFNK